MGAPYVGDVVESFASETVRVRRKTGAFVDGRFVVRADHDIEIAANVQPATGRDMKLLPEGTRTEETIVLHTLATLYTAESAPSSVPDSLHWNGSWWRVMTVVDWAHHGFRKVFATREAVGREAAA